LIDLWYPELETQVNVAQGDGERVDYIQRNGRPNFYYTDGKGKWMHRRALPGAAGFNNEICFDLADHAEAIGTTGWNSERRISEAVFYDVDAILDHVAGLTPEKIDEVVAKLKALDYVTLRKSTRGGGVHVQVDTAAIETKTHNAHTLLARFILDKISQDCGYEFSDAVDVCGGNIWLWHRDATKGNRGYEPIQAAARIFDDIPDDWRSLVKVNRKESTEPSDYTEFDRAKALDALAKLSTGRCDDYAEWLAIGMILKTVGCSCDEWETWSKQSERFQEGACQAKWDGFEGSGLGLGTLLMYAREDSAPTGDEFYDAPPTDEDEQAAVDSRSGGLTTEQLLHKGFITKVAKWHKKRIQYPDERMGAVSGILLQSMLMARKVRLADNTRPNIVIALPVISGGGKTDLVNTIKLIGENCRPIVSVIERITGAAALEDELNIVDSALLVFEEAHQLIRMMNTTSDSNLAGIAASVKMLYSQSGVRVPMRKMARDKKEKRQCKRATPEGSGNLPHSKPRILDQPHLSALFTGPPSLLMNSFSETSLRDGLVGRIMIIGAPLIAEGNDFPEDDQVMFVELLRIANAWGKVNPPTRQIMVENPDEDGGLEICIDSPVPHVWHREPEGHAVSMEAKAEFRKLMVVAEARKDEVASSSWGRAHEISCKLELLLAGSEFDPSTMNVAEYMIPAHVTRKAISMARTIITQKMLLVSNRAEDEEHENRLDKIRGRLAEHKCMKWRNLYRATHLQVLQFTGLIESLLMSGEIGTDAVLQNGRVINHIGKYVWLTGHKPEPESTK
jgi:hypothetical protein